MTKHFFSLPGHRGIYAAIGSALLFGIATPLAKLLLRAEVSPLLLAGLLYLGSGLGLQLYRFIKHLLNPQPRPQVAPKDLALLAAAICCGGIMAPVFALSGLLWLGAGEAALLLNFEGVATALIAWFVFKENFDRRIASGMALIVAGAVILSFQPAAFSGQTAFLPALLVVAACVLWGIDNNLTGRIALNDAVWITATKGLVAGLTNCSLAFLLAKTGQLPAQLPSFSTIGAALVLGLISYGLSLTLYVIALRYVGTARAGAYFGLAPFFGAAAALLLGQSWTWTFAAAAVLMGIGTWLHVCERHQHMHVHPEQTHSHWHRHDDAHHDHDHPVPAAPGTWHYHEHYHPRLVHDHPHFPDAAHRHQH